MIRDPADWQVDSLNKFCVEFGTIFISRWIYTAGTVLNLGSIFHFAFYVLCYLKTCDV